MAVRGRWQAGRTERRGGEINAALMVTSWLLLLSCLLLCPLPSPLLFRAKDGLFTRGLQPLTTRGFARAGSPGEVTGGDCTACTGQTDDVPRLGWRLSLCAVQSVVWEREDEGRLNIMYFVLAAVDVHLLDLALVYRPPPPRC
jgi:hypothetical protein